MHQDIIHSYERRVARTRRRSVLRKIVGTLACLVIFCTTYVLILPAITMEQKTFCGLEEHTHTDACYKQTSNRNLICTADQLTVHSHTDACYAEGGTLICGQADYLAHTHNEQCFDTNGELVCTLNERSAHQHTDDCYTPGETQEVVLHVHSEACNGLERGELICEEIERSGHSHNESCYVVTNELSCTIPEGHVHGDGCYTFPLICTEIDETHVHDDICYDSTPILICCIEQENHIHETACYQKDLICTLAEDPGHSHSDECYAWNNVIICGKEEGEAEPTEAPETILICTEPIAVTHVHGDECFEIITSEQENICNNIEEGHVHSDTCYERICGLEEHVHSIACYSDPEADLETEKDWKATFAHVNLTGIWEQDVISIAQTQLGYTESTRNYVVSEDNSIYGYTRYGDWYGIPYGDWCAMYASFCLKYAGVENMPLDSVVRSWVESLTVLQLYHKAEVYEPKPGNLIFFDWDHNGLSDHVGLVVELIPAEGDKSAQVKTIEGNNGNSVKYFYYDIDDSDIIGYSELPDNTAYYDCGTARHVHNEYCSDIDGNLYCQKQEHVHSAECIVVEEEPTDLAVEEGAPYVITRTAETENYIVTVSYSSELYMPEDAELRVLEYAKDSEIFLRRSEEAGGELAWLLNIGFFAGEEEVELSGDFAVVVTSKQGNVVDSSIHHFTDAGIEKLEGESVTDGLDEGQSAIAFSSGSFSDFGGFSGTSRAATDTLYTLDALGPNETLQAGKQYYIYVKGSVDNKQHYFLSEQPASRGPLTNSGPEGGTGNTTTFTYSPWNGGTWYMYESQISSVSNGNGFLWTAEAGSNGTFRLKNSNGRYLDIAYYGVTTSTNPVNITVDSRNVAKKLSVPSGYYYNYTLSINRSEDIYIAQVTSSGSSSGGAIPEAKYPEAVHTGNVEVNVVNFYNIVDDAGTVSSLAGCRFNVIDQNKKIVASIVSGSDTSVSLSGLTAGTYTLEQVYVPDGYFGDPEPKREFTIESNGEVNFGEDGSIFVNRPVAVISSDKTAVVKDYEKRIYEITMEASSQMKAYDLEPIEVLFVIDQSNSMLFPSSLNDTGKKFTINSSGTGNVDRLDALDLDKSQVYYFISDPNGSSTVWALWHNGETWLYQDASYYSKAWHKLHADSSNNYEGYYEQLGSNIVFPKTGAAYGTTDVSEGKTNGGDIAVGVGGSLKTYVDQNSPEFTIYTAGGQYNRLHYLEIAVASAITQLEAIDERNYVGLIKFTKKVNDADCVVPARFNSNHNHLNNLIGKVNRINTDGGTRQDEALKKAIEYQNAYYPNATKKYTILITDGAPALDASKDTPEEMAKVYQAVRDNAKTLTNMGNSQLITVPLSMGDVEGGSELMEEIQTAGYYPCEDAELLLNKLSEIMFQAILSSKQDITPEAHIVDTISDSFYPVAWSDHTVKDRQLLYTEANGRNWYVLQPNDRISLDGSYYTGQTNNTGAYGVLKNTHEHTEHCYYYWQGSDNQIHQEYVCTIQNGDYYIQWDQQALPSNPGWKGIVYVKAKEDFIGGNAIDTNEDAHIAIGISRKEYETPTVNVRLLEMNENSSEVTVYLGDLINDGQSGQFSTPLATLQDFFDKIYFTKINVEEAAYTNNGILMNKVDPDATADDGLEGDRFYLKYAISQLTLAQWGALTDMNDEGKSRNPITVAYTYDDPSSHGPVGYFTISLEKNGEDSNYLTHQAQHDCHSKGNSCEDPAEEYMLKVVYTAYKLSEEGRPQNTVHNGSGSPGTEVGGQWAGTTVETGLGVVESENIHEVHVISGSLKVTKTLTEDLANTLKAQGKTEAEFTFTLETDTASVGSIVAGSTAGSYSFQYGDAGATSFAITVPLTLAEGQTTYTASATVTDLPRGTYKLTENPGDDFNMDSLTVDVNATNCTYGQDDTTSAVFYMGYCNTEKENVIGKAEATDVYTSYLRSPNGVRGEAVVVNDTNSVDAEVPVQKVWSDGNTQHTSDAVYVVLYKTVVNGETSTPELVITEVDGVHVAKILKLDSDNNWTGKFKVPLISGEDDVSNYGYHVHEVKLVGENTEDAVQAILENDGATVYFTELENDLIAFGDTHYMVTYSEAEDTLVVTNHVARTLPKSGGPGTYLYTIGGLIMMSIALIYGFILNRKHRREAGV